jgi:hypothetical protein
MIYLFIFVLLYILHIIQNWKKKIHVKNMKNPQAFYPITNYSFFKFTSCFISISIFKFEK